MPCSCWPKQARRRRATSGEKPRAYSSKGSEQQPASVSSHGRPGIEELGLAWISEEEHRKIELLRSSLTPTERTQLASEPAHIKHDLMLCRFLRGHGGAVPRALKALRALLQFRIKHRSTLDSALGSVPEDLEDFDETLSPLTQRFQQIKMLQLPGRLGSNCGLPLSMLVVGHFRLQDVAAIGDQELLEWFLSLVEVRVLCLHNQSLREHRMAKVVEVRDCAGFAWSQFLASPLVLRKVPSLLEVALVYPEVVESLMCFNMSSSFKGNPFVKAAFKALPRVIRDKTMFAEKGDWRHLICSPKGLSPRALPEWTRHLEEFRPHPLIQTLTSTHSQLVRSISVSAGQAVAWHSRCAAANRVGKSKPMCFTISVHLFEAGGTPTMRTPYCKTFKVQREDFTNSGSFTAESDGTALLEIELGSREQVSNMFACISCEPVASLERMASASVVACVVPTGSHDDSEISMYAVKVQHIAVALLSALFLLWFHW